MQYRSRFEKRIAEKTPSARYEAVKITYTVEKTYTPDWLLPNGILVESKGRWTSAERSMLLAIRRQHPHLDIRMVFQRASNTLSKTSKTTYSGWCEKHGVLWAEGTIPPEWLSERRE